MFYEFVEVSVVAVSPVAFLSSKSLCGSLWAHSAQRGTGPLSETRRGGCCRKVYQRDSVDTESSLMFVFFKLISLTLCLSVCTNRPNNQVVVKTLKKNLTHKSMENLKGRG